MAFEGFNMRGLLRDIELNEQEGKLIESKLRNLPKNASIRRKRNVFELNYGKVFKRYHYDDLRQFSATFRLMRSDLPDKWLIDSFSVFELADNPKSLIYYSIRDKKEEARHESLLRELLEANGFKIDNIDKVIERW